MCEYVQTSTECQGLWHMILIRNLIMKYYRYVFIIAFHLLLFSHFNLCSCVTLARKSSGSKIMINYFSQRYRLHIFISLLHTLLSSNVMAIVIPWQPELCQK